MSKETDDRDRKFELATSERTDWIRRVRPLGPDDAPHCRAHIQFRSDCDQCVSERAMQP